MVASASQSTRDETSQAVETQQISWQEAADRALKTSHFALKINANLSQIFEKTTLWSNFFRLFY